jgi:hypothetical protein
MQMRLSQSMAPKETLEIIIDDAEKVAGDKVLHAHDVGESKMIGLRQ